MVDYYGYYDTYAWDFDSESYFESFGRPDDSWELISEQRHTENIGYPDNIIDAQAIKLIKDVLEAWDWDEVEYIAKPYAINVQEKAWQLLTDEQKFKLMNLYWQKHPDGCRKSCGTPIIPFNNFPLRNLL